MDTLGTKPDIYGIGTLGSLDLYSGKKNHIKVIGGSDLIFETLLLS
jgi:hypothetical protein